ncbi:hypothetical protein EYF80_060557 [Liparis tanakae]|uniref:Uncharacterized protein n=1 Tax=Liparis tanakae TaxID=230148 RepID=A0A4Z2EKA2_9TELE|nr:hypothetical protein EYF80_060557 [Liparis tanakae]
MEKVAVPASQSSSTPMRLGLGLTSTLSLLLCHADSLPANHSTHQDRALRPRRLARPSRSMPAYARPTPLKLLLLSLTSQ